LDTAAISITTEVALSPLKTDRAFFTTVRDLSRTYRTGPWSALDSGTSGAAPVQGRAAFNLDFITVSSDCLALPLWFYYVERSAHIEIRALKIKIVAAGNRITERTVRGRALC
jgi:hypothetical protein